MHELKAPTLKIKPHHCPDLQPRQHHHRLLLPSPPLHRRLALQREAQVDGQRRDAGAGRALALRGFVIVKS